MALGYSLSSMYAMSSGRVDIVPSFTSSFGINWADAFMGWITAAACTAAVGHTTAVSTTSAIGTRSIDAST